MAFHQGEQSQIVIFKGNLRSRHATVSKRIVAVLTDFWQSWMMLMQSYLWIEGKHNRWHADQVREPNHGSIISLHWPVAAEVIQILSVQSLKIPLKILTQLWWPADKYEKVCWQVSKRSLHQPPTQCKHEALSMLLFEYGGTLVLSISPLSARNNLEDCKLQFVQERGLHMVSCNIQHLCSLLHCLRNKDCQQNFICRALLKSTPRPLVISAFWSTRLR